MECIVLAGGLGTRLQDEVKDLPKCMAPINGKPFLSFVFDYLETQFVDHVILSLGFRYEPVMEWINTKGFTFKLHRVIEKEPLGTGGGIKLALNKSLEKEVFILNGDTLFDVDLRKMKQEMTPTTKALLALKPMNNFDRYGSVQMNEEHIITSFEEKKPCSIGLINGGTYLLNKSLAAFENYPSQFSMEKDFLEKEVDNKSLKGFESDGYFIDIGIPEDYQKAQQEIK